MVHVNNGGEGGSGKIQRPTGKCRLIFSTKESSEEAVLQEEVLTKAFYPEKLMNTLIGHSHREELYIPGASDGFIFLC